MARDLDRDAQEESRELAPSFLLTGYPGARRAVIAGAA
jgi:hypothetical protein